MNHKRSSDGIRGFRNTEDLRLFFLSCSVWPRGQPWIGQRKRAQWNSRPDRLETGCTPQIANSEERNRIPAARR